MERGPDTYHHHDSRCLPPQFSTDHRHHHRISPLHSHRRHLSDLSYSVCWSSEDEEDIVGYPNQVRLKYYDHTSPFLPYLCASFYLYSNSLIPDVRCSRSRVSLFSWARAPLLMPHCFSKWCAAMLRLLGACVLLFPRGQVLLLLLPRFFLDGGVLQMACLTRCLRFVGSVP